MKNIYRLWLASTLFLAGCASESDAVIVDFCDKSNGTYQNCSAVRDAGDCLESKKCENSMVLGKDTYLGNFEGNLTKDPYKDNKGYIGKIDSDCREISDGKFSADMDFIAVEAKPGTPLSIRAIGVNGSMTRPIILAYNSLGGELIFSMAPKNGYAQIQLLAPEKKFYISIEEYENYNAQGQEDFCSALVVGGDDYLYHLEISNIESEVIDLGKLSAPLTRKDKIQANGETMYYRFKTAADVESVDLTIKPDSKSMDDYPVLSPIFRNTVRIKETGGYEWVLSGSALATREKGSNVAKYKVTKEFAACDELVCEYMFVVTDYNGNSGYDYLVEISKP